MNRKPLIAVIDTGYRGDESLIKGSVFIIPEEDPSQGLPHGPEIIKIIQRINPNADIISIKAFNREGYGQIDDVIKAIECAIDLQVDIINMSFVALKNEKTSKIIPYVEKALKMGIKVVAAAGDWGVDYHNFVPACIDGVYVISGMDENGKILEITNKTIGKNYCGNHLSSFSAALATAELSLGNNLDNCENIKTIFIDSINDENKIILDKLNNCFKTTSDCFGGHSTSSWSVYYYYGYTDTITRTGGIAHIQSVITIDHGTYSMASACNLYVTTSSSWPEATQQLTSASQPKVLFTYTFKKDITTDSGATYNSHWIGFGVGNSNWTTQYVYGDWTKTVISANFKNGSTQLPMSNCCHWWKYLSFTYPKATKSIVYWCADNGNGVVGSAAGSYALNSYNYATSGGTLVNYYYYSDGYDASGQTYDPWNTTSLFKAPTGYSAAGKWKIKNQATGKWLGASDGTWANATSFGQDSGSWKNVKSATNYVAGNELRAFAQWTPDTYSVTYYKGDATSGTAPSAQTKTYGKSLTLRTNSGSLAHSSTSGSTSRNAAITLSYNANGGTGAPANNTGTAVSCSGTYPITWTASGWGTSSGTTTKVYDFGGTCTDNKKIDLYPAWTKTSGTTTYTAKSASATISSTKPTRAGYNFLGWSTSSSATSASYSSGGTYTESINNNKTVTLYAVWSPKPIRIYYNGNGGTFNGSSSFKLNTPTNNYLVKVSDGSYFYQTITASGSEQKDAYNYNNTSSISFTRTGYHVESGKEWVPNTGDKSVVNQATEYTYAQWVAKANESSTYYEVNLYVNWVINTYSVKYNGNGNTGGSMSNSSHTYNVEKNLSSNAFTRTNYIFSGWATSASGAVVYSNGQAVTNLSTTHGATVNLYAIWKGPCDASASGKTLGYTGAAQTGVTGSNVTWSGTTSATNAGTYTAKATPSSGHYWSDGTNGTKTITWYIQSGTTDGIWVWTGSSWVFGKPYVYNSGWKPAQAYVYNNGWKPCKN